MQKNIFFVAKKNIFGETEINRPLQIFLSCFGILNIFLREMNSAIQN